MTSRGDNSGNRKLTKLNEAIGMVCHRSLGVMDANFLCQTIGVIKLPAPLCISEDTKIQEALGRLGEARIGCLLVVAPDGKVSGIFSERDCLLKVVPHFDQMRSEPISSVMTRDPVTQSVDCTIGFALTLMSEGGFRHIPVVDEAGYPISLLSVKEVMDFIVGRFIDDALAYNPEVEDPLRLTE